MSTSDKTIEQVKSILNRLDRSIDAAREKRLHGTTPTAQTPPVPQPFRDAGSQQIGAESPIPPAVTPPPTSKFGRAQAIRLDDRPRF